MNTPLFKVGERVGLVSRSLPQFNGEYTVERILNPRETFRSRVSGKLFRNGSDNYSYLLNKTMVCEEIDDVCWYESALRKIHKTSQFSFDELMQELKVGKFDTIEA